MGDVLTQDQSLRKSIRIRLARWHEFRRHIALRCKIYFSYHLSNRGYFGKVIFDHVTGTLQLKVLQRVYARENSMLTCV